MIYEHIPDKHYSKQEYFYANYDYQIWKCTSCENISIFGDWVEYPSHQEFGERRLYPIGPQIVPPSHILSNELIVPREIIESYEKAWLDRFKSPAIFVLRIRKTLEMICSYHNIKERLLYDSLKKLAEEKNLSGQLIEILDYLRKIGNLGAHFDNRVVDIWDAELIDNFFRFLIDYLFIMPLKLKKMSQRINRL